MNRRSFFGRGIVSLGTVPVLSTILPNEPDLYSDDLITKAKQFIEIFQLQDSVLRRFTCCPYYYKDREHNIMMLDRPVRTERIERQPGNLAFYFSDFNAFRTCEYYGMKIFNHNGKPWKTTSFRGGYVTTIRGDCLKLSYEMSLGGSL